MPFIGNKPSAVPLTSADITDGIIVNDDIANSTINLTTKVTGTLPVANGGTGVATTTAYGILAGGTTATGAFQNIGAGTSTYVLTSNGASALPSFQVAPSSVSAGQVIQVLGATDSTTRSTTSASFVTASNTLSVTITPSSVSSRFAIFVTHFANNDAAYGYYTIFRGSTNLGGTLGMTESSSDQSSGAYNFLDSPATTSPITYQAYMRSINTSFIQYMGKTTETAQIIVMEIKG